MKLFDEIIDELVYYKKENKSVLYSGISNKLDTEIKKEQMSALSSTNKQKLKELDLEQILEQDQFEESDSIASLYPLLSETQKREQEVAKKEAKLAKRQAELDRLERELLERENKVASAEVKKEKHEFTFASGGRKLDE